MKKILCFGSLNIDDTYRVPHFVRAGETLAAEGVKTYCGGKGLNQSVALARAGATVWHAGCIGTDGTMLIQALQKAHVNTDFVHVSEHETTGHAIIQNTSEGENCILLFGGANKTVSKEQIDAVLEHFESGDMLVLQNEINNIPYLLTAAKHKGMRTAFTPAPMQQAVRKYPLEKADFILLNETEATALVDANAGTAARKSALADMLSKMYPNTCFVLTLGSDGALYIRGQERVFQPAFPVHAADTTAAGDTFAGFFLQSIIAGKTTAAALEIAAKAAAICVTREGASPSIPAREEIDCL